MNLKPLLDPAEDSSLTNKTYILVLTYLDGYFVIVNGITAMNPPTILELENFIEVSLSKLSGK